VAKIRNFTIKSYIGGMKLKFLVPLVTGILAAVLLYISLVTTDNSTADKLASFGLGAVSVIFISSLISAIKSGKTKAL
jgi:hypothetical protein